MILKVENLTKQFGGLTAVEDINFHIAKSEILGIIGPNGAGKSTLLNVICGFHPISKGKVFFEGRDITGLKANRVAQLGIGRNFQASLLFMELSVLENVFTGFHLSYATSIYKRLLRLHSARMEEAELRQKALEILEFMRLASLKDEQAKNLPHGHQRILSICIALAAKPRLLLLDEPLTGMNHTEIDTMLELIRKIRDSGVTIAMIEHNMGAVMNLCDRIVVLDHGQKIAEGLPKEIQEHVVVIDAYLGKE